MKHYDLFSFRELDKNAIRRRRFLKARNRELERKERQAYPPHIKNNPQY